MPSPRSPDLARNAAPFDPAILDRAIIAIPLLAAIRVDRETKEWVRAYHSDLLQRYNAAVFYRANFPGGIEKAWRATLERLEEAKRIITPTRDQLIEMPNETFGVELSFAWLDGAIAQWLLRRDASADEPAIERIYPTQFEIIIDVNLEYPDSRAAAKDWIVNKIPEAKAAAGVSDPAQGVLVQKTQSTNQYVFARLEGEAIEALVALDTEQAKKLAEERRAAFAKEYPNDPVPVLNPARFRAIHSIWPDFPIRSCINKSIATVKVDAAHRAFSALGEGITWAVMDSGIWADHPHFASEKNIDKTSPLHRDFTGAPGEPGPLRDEFGHGTHVAGIIAGEQHARPGDNDESMKAISRVLQQNGDPMYVPLQLDVISGMAPRCKLVSLKVLDDVGQGNVSNLIAAIGYIQELNGYGRSLRIHGVNISLGYDFDPKWFACGQSPLCVEVNRLVKSGVVVVVAAGNTGYGTVESKEGTTETGLDMTINDPGNADLAITVGATHRDMPHIYGVSFFSSKGPTGDGRSKPDLIAPGEKIISCAQGQLKKKSAPGQVCSYVETSGTSMAAPHVSGVVAAFLSIRREFIGDPERVKQIIVSTATDLRRDRYFQGAGIVDLMRAIQSV